MEDPDVSNCGENGEESVTVIPRKAVRGCVEVSRDDLAGPLGTQTGFVSVMIHEGDLLRRFVRCIEVVLIDAHVHYKWVQRLD